MRYLEETFDCSGFCSVNKYYVFSDVNEDEPLKDCKVEVINFLNDNLFKFVLSAAAVTGVLLISFIFSFILCCKKPKG